MPPIATAAPAARAAAYAAAIHFEDVGKSFGHGPAVLDRVSLCVQPGEFVAVVGPSGCGKSTLLRLMAGLEKPSAGRLRVEHAGTADRAGRSAFVFQEPALLPWRTVAGNISLPLELERRPGPERAALVRDSLELIGLSPDDAKKFPRQLSGGMRMRVSLARSLVTRPGLLLLDEPFGALDDLLRTRLNSDVQRLWCEQRWTAVFVTHNVAEAVFLAGRVLVMSRNPGRIAGEVSVPFPTPRDPALKSTPAFAQLTGEIARLLNGL